ncbi:hypothetical protein P7C70_g4304, partial [Phenoliferia sp. Uapishka_3]
MPGISTEPAGAHRNTLPPTSESSESPLDAASLLALLPLSLLTPWNAYSVPVGISSKAVEDFIDLEIKESDNINLAQLFPAEDNGWHGFVEWEREPERCKKAAIILKTKHFTPIPEFQMNPLPTTNPILLGDRWKEAHLAMGTCCGTRRVEQIACYPGEGDELLSAPWAEGAIGTAVWKGVYLKKVLKYFGGVPANSHIEGIGADTYFKKNEVYNYAVSVPYSKVKINEVTSSAHRIKVYSANTSYKATRDRIALLQNGGDNFLPITRPVEGVSIETDEEYAREMAKRGPREPIN